MTQINTDLNQKLFSHRSTQIGFLLTLRAYARNARRPPTLIVWILLAAFVFTVSACDDQISKPLLELQTTMPPTFKPGGDAYLREFMVHELVESNRNTRYVHNDSKDKLLWKLTPIDKSSWQFINIRPIVYGVATATLHQEFPLSEPPAPLVEGKIYSVSAMTTSGNGAGLFFIIRDGKPVELSMKDAIHVSD